MMNARTPFRFEGPFRARCAFDLGGRLVAEGASVDLSALTDRQVWNLWVAHYVDVIPEEPTPIPVLRLLAELEAIAAAPIVITGPVVSDVAPAREPAQAAPSAPKPPPPQPPRRGHRPA